MKRVNDLAMISNELVWLMMYVGDFKPFRLNDVRYGLFSSREMINASRC